MNFEPGLRIGEVVSNDKLREMFKCGNMGGMRKSNTTNTLIIISDHTKGLYEDKWLGDVLHYTGMGKSGNQDIFFAQNKTLAESDRNGVDVHLFEVFIEKEYVYMGKLKLADKPYQEKQKGEDGVLRNVWMFPLKIIDRDSKAAAIDSRLLHEKYEQKQKQAKKLDDNLLAQRAKESQSDKVSTRQTSSTTYERNAYVSEYAKRRAKGICQLCEKHAPFVDKKGEAYLESHHIVWLSQGGEDTIENTVALCPNCHRKMHSLNLDTDRKTLLLKAKRL